MSAVQLERLQEQMQRLRLFKSRERLEALLQDATAKEASYADFLDTLFSEEVASKTAKDVTMRTHLARSPRPRPGRAWMSRSRSTRSRACSSSTRLAICPSTALAPISSFSSSAGGTSGGR